MGCMRVFMIPGCIVFRFDETLSRWEVVSRSYGNGKVGSRPRAVGNPR